MQDGGTEELVLNREGPETSTQTPARSSRGWLIVSISAALAAVLIMVGFVILRNTANPSMQAPSSVDTVLEIAQADRGNAVEVAGATLTGDQLAVASLQGNVVVLNVWGSWCAPCRSEAPGLAKLSAEFADQNVKFVGINVKDNVGAATAFERNFGITYPSISDSSGQAQLALSETVPPQAIPSTIVLDRQGRVAARVIGEVRESTLRALIATALAEIPTASGQS